MSVSLLEGSDGIAVALGVTGRPDESCVAEPLINNPVSSWCLPLLRVLRVPYNTMHVCRRPNGVGFCIY
jgi:hypothetical protein